MRGRIKAHTKEKFQHAMLDVIQGLSRKVQVYMHPIKSECPNCMYDKMTDSSTGKCSWTVITAPQKQAEYAASGGIGIHYKYFLKGRCPVCLGKGYLETQRRRWADCLITWNPDTGGNDMTYTSAGTEGSTTVQLKTDPKYFEMFKNCVKLVVDGVECKLSKPPLLRGLGNQTVLIISAFTTDKPKIDSTEIIKDYS